MMLTVTLFLVFLDSDDKCISKDLIVALCVIQEHNRDIVEFGYRMRLTNSTSLRYWRVPTVSVATPPKLYSLFHSGMINCHLHCKVICTKLYRMTIRSMMSVLMQYKLLRYEDRLHYTFLMNYMKMDYEYIKILGERRYFGLKGNNISESSQNVNQSIANHTFVQQCINRTFHYMPRLWRK
jgi:hypothetical protein